MAKKLELHGLFPALATPFDNGLQIMDTEFASLVSRVAQTPGVGGLVINGHCGEVTTLSPKERQHTVKVARAEAPSGIPIIAGIESLSTQGAIERAQEAKDAGADAGLILPPFDYIVRRGSARTWQAPYRFFSTLAERVDLPLVVFEYMAWSGLAYTTDTLVRLAEIDNVVAVKDAIWNVSIYAEHYAALKGKVSFLAACDAPELLGMMFIGADGALVGISNIATELWAAFVSDCLAGKFNEARQLFVERLMPIMGHVFGDLESNPTSFNAMTKEALVQMGQFTNSLVRPPEMDATDQDREMIKRGLRMAGLVPAEGVETVESLSAVERR